MRPTFSFHLKFQLLLILLSSVAGDAQSPWTQTKAGFYTQVAWQGIPAYHQVFNGFEVSELNGKIRDQALQLYGEYGFNRKWTGIIALPLRWTQRRPIDELDPPMATLTGLGNASLGLKRGFMAAGHQFAGTLTFDLPAGRQEKSGLRTGFNAFTVHPSFSAGKGLRRIYWYLYTGAGIRTNNYSSFVQSGGECGVHFGRVWVIAFSEWMQSLKDGNRLEADRLNTGLFTDHQSWWSYGLKTIIKTGRFTGLVFSAGGALNGYNVANRPALSVGYYFKWD